jgi:predicted permease
MDDPRNSVRNRFQFLELIWLDLRQSLRSLLHSPAFSAAAVISLALGIGANTAIFSFVNAILLKKLPVPEPDRLVTFARIDRGESRGDVWRMTTIDGLAKRGTAFTGVFGTFPKAINFSSEDAPQWLMGELVTGEYFQTLEVQPFVARLLTAEDVRNATANPMCVISYSLWQHQFAGDPTAVGRSVTLNGHPYRVLGVTARGFYGADLDHRIDLQIPATRIADFMPAFGQSTGVDWLKTLSWLKPFARLKPGLSLAAAQEQTQGVFDQIQLENNGGRPAEKQGTLLLKDGSQGFNATRSALGRPVVVLMAVVALVLLIACANLASLLLARAQARAKEIAVRLSIGAPRFRLVRQLFMESLLLAVCGGIAGVIVSFWIVGTLLAFLNSGKSPVFALHVTPDWKVLAFSTTLSLATAILFGLIPAWQSTKPDLLSDLQLGGSGRVNRLVLRRGLVVIQIALSLVVVFAAGLLTQTLRTLKTVDLGFQPDQVIALSVDPAANGHSSNETSSILDEILTRARALPAVKAASLATSTPNGSMAISMSINVPGYTVKGSGDDIVAFNFVSPDYFNTLGQHLLRGRDFNARDLMNSPRVAIVTEKLARHYFEGRDPLGRKFGQGGGDVEIVGVVQDARDQSVRNGPQETAYLPEKQSQTSGLTLLVRSLAPSSTIPPLLAIVKNIDPRMPVFSVHTLDMDVEAGLSTERILGYLSTLFAALAILLAGIGLYSILAYSVARRTREIGIRFAIGAQKSNVAVLFARESCVLLLVGVLIGVPIALASGRALESLLFGVAAADPPTLVISAALLAVAVSLAVTVPLWRASRVDPVNALRHE